MKAKNQIMTHVSQNISSTVLYTKRMFERTKPILLHLQLATIYQAKKRMSGSNGTSKKRHPSVEPTPRLTEKPLIQFPAEFLIKPPAPMPPNL
ncbi:hypothetical protein PRUPE_2G011600 [Prunus persica]|uniref:Uncharacterized protein n=1 Tax=Prunus persica TaxID=3760 RepID=A0A251Q9B1_PRUPE|nr:hypothetical protein PRUPE_2G011600 [Prunus persica]ONI20363.1 hypothetical protein PRUPE_2G011600 [Prunus persica]